MRWGIPVVVASGLLAALACSSFGSDSDPTPDAADAAVTSDASTPPAPPAPPPDDGGLPSSCVVLVETRFDDLTGWKQPSSNDAPAFLTDASFTSPSSALGAAVFAADGGKFGAEVYRDVAFDGGSLGDDSLDLRFAVYLEANDSSYAELGCGLEIRTPNDEQLRYLLGRFTNGSTLEAQWDDHTRDGGAKRLQEGFVPGWHQVHVVVSPTPTGGAKSEWSITGPGTTGTSSVTLPANPRTDTLDHVRIRCGILYATQADNADASTINATVDDVRLGRCPR